MREKMKSKQKMKNSLSQTNYDDFFKKNRKMKKELTMNDLNNNYEREFYANKNNISEIIINKSNSMTKLINNNNKKFDITPNIKKELINISYLWNCSGISSKYKVNFINNYQLMNKEEKIELIKEEKQKIEILIKKLKQFNEDFCLRKKIIKKIKEEIKELNIISKENKCNIIDKIVKYFEELRLYSVNSVLDFYEAKFIINSLFKNNNTILDLKMLYKLYLFDKDYLLKINDDISFIKECPILSDYIEMNKFKNMDTFLVNCSYKLIDKSDKINDKKIIPIDDKMKTEIKKCKYIIKNEKFSLPQNSFSFFISNYLKTPKPQKKLILKLNNNQNSCKQLLNVTNKNSKNKQNNYPPKIKEEFKRYKLLIDKAKKLKKENENLKKIMEKYEKEKNEEQKRVIKEKEKADKEIEKERLKRIEIEKQNQELIQKLRKKKSDNSIDSKQSKNKDKNNNNDNGLIFNSKEGKISIDANKSNNNINLIKKNEINDDYSKEFNDAIEENIEKIEDEQNKEKEKEKLKSGNNLKEKEGKSNKEKLINKNNINQGMNKNSNNDNKINKQDKIYINNNIFDENNKKENINENDIKLDDNINDEINKDINNNIDINKDDNDEKNENNQEKDKTFDEKKENLEEINISDYSNIKNNDKDKESNKEEIINTDIINVEDKQNKNESEDISINKNVINLNSNFENKNLDNNNKKENNVKKQHLINKYNEIIEKTGYKVEYYLDKLETLIAKIKKDIHINKISDDIKSLFNPKSEEKIYDESTYLYGMYPKVITCISKESEMISGICSFYYEIIGEHNTIIVRINTLFAVGDWKSQFIKMINFVKSNAQFNQIKITLHIAISDKGGDGGSLEVKKFFEEKLLFKVSNVIEEKEYQKVEMIFNRFEVKRIFCFNLKSILSSYNKEKANEAEILDDEIKDIMKAFEKDDKYVNLFPVFSLLSNLNKIEKFSYYKLDFFQKGFHLNLKKANMDFIKVIKDKTLDDDDIKDFCQNYETCIYRLLYPIYKQNNLILPCDVLEINLDKNLLFCHSLLMNGYYYNKISKDIYKGYDKDTKCNYYLVPLNDENNKLFFYEMNENSIQKYIDDKKNIYRLFVDLLTGDDKENKFLEKNKKENEDISLYIPSFKISDNFHYSNIHHILKKILSFKDINEEEIKFISFDGLVSIEFNCDNFISNNFNYSISEDEENIVIKNNFIFGLINFSILKNKNYIYNSFLHLIYVTQENWKRF